MSFGDIRSRIWLASMLPVTLIVLLLVAVFLVARLGDNEMAHQQRARSLARQLAASSEYGVFSANTANLQAVASAALHEPALRSVVILDAAGALLAKAGVPGYALPLRPEPGESEVREVATGSDLFLQPIMAAQLPLEDLFQAKGIDAKPAKFLGHVLLEVSNDDLRERERELLWLGLALGLAGLLLGGVLALSLGRRVIGPITRVSRTIHRIGQGDLAARAEVLPDDPLRDLQHGLNQMAASLESGRDELERRVAVATSALREKKEEAEMATLAKSHFLAAASHDLRQPTHALGMFVARLGQLPHSAETRRLIESLERSVQAMQDLLDGLLDVSRLDAGAVPVQARPFAVADLFEQLRSELAQVAVEKGLRLRIRPSDAAVLSDPALLHRILLNLLGNALRYTHTGGVLLACRCTANRQLVRIEVWDSGIGIAAEHQEAVFKEFYQVGNLARDRGKGLGLGLNIVQRTAQLLGYRLQMRSQLGVGTRFSIEVPLAPRHLALDRRHALRTQVIDNLAGLVILVIEDDALAREALVSLLSSWGSVVLEADGLSTAQKQLTSGAEPDLIISDYRLSDGEDGIQAIGRLRAMAGRPIPACLTSGDTGPGLMQKAKEAGLSLLHKPVRPAKLRSLIRRLATPAQGAGDALT